MSARYKLQLPGITCTSCVASVKSILSHVSGERYLLESYDVDITNKTIVIMVGGHDSPREDVRDYLISVLEPFEAAVENELLEEKPKTWWTKLSAFFLSHWFQGVVGTLAGISLLILSLTVGSLPMAAMIAIGAISTILTLILGAKSYYHAFMKFIKTRELSMDTLFAISTITIISVSLTAFFVPWLPMMFEAGLLIFGFRHIGLAIEESIKRKMALDKTFQHLLPFDVEFFQTEGVTVRRSIAVINPEDILLIKSGEIIPLDGICLTEGALVYDTIKTGSPLARPLKKGEILISGMRLAEGSTPIRLKVSANLGNSYLARLDNRIEKAHMEKAPIEETATRVLQYFIPSVIAIAIISGIVIGIFFPPALAIQCAISVLVSACPCTLGLVVPLAVKIGMQKGAQNGVAFKSAKSMQSADSIDVVIFDLNGTLTTGIPTLSRVLKIQTEFDENTLLAYAAAIEKNSPHPMAKAICEKALLNNIAPIQIAQDLSIDASHHSGLRATIDDHVWAIGNEDMMRELGIDYSRSKKNLKLQSHENLVYIARDNELLGYFVLSDPLRKDANRTIDALIKLGKEVHVCTGADEKTAHRYASLLGIPKKRVASACVGMAEKAGDKSKINYIKQLQSQGKKVAFVGDGSNDTLSLVESNFGIAVKSNSGSEMTQQEAGAVIQGGSLLPVANVFAIARQTVSNIKQNLGFSLGYNIAAMLLAGGLLVGVGLTLNPGVGVALMIIQMVFVLWVAYRFKQEPLEHFNESAEIENEVESESYQYCNQKMKPKGNTFDCENEHDLPRQAPILSPILSKQSQDLNEACTPQFVI